MYYLPEGGKVELDINKLSKFKSYVITWYNLNDGTYKSDTIESLKNISFMSPESGWGKDYILLIDNVEKKFPYPASEEYNYENLDKRKDFRQKSNVAPIR